MDTFCKNIQNVSEEELVIVAQFYEGQKQFRLAIDYYARATLYQEALNCYILSEDEDLIPNAIKMIGSIKNKELFNRFKNYLVGADGSEPKDPIHLFNLCVDFGLEKQSNLAADSIILFELQNGNFKNAKLVLLKLMKKLEEKKVKISYELKNKLHYIQCYFLAKKYIQMGDHFAAALLLDQVCQFISYFESYLIQIMTTCIVECTKAGLKKMANKWAVYVCNEKYRSQLLPNFKEKIEKIALQQRSLNQKEEPQLPCPFCKTKILSY